MTVQKKALAVIALLSLYILLYFGFAGIEYLDESDKDAPVIDVAPSWRYFILASITMIVPVFYLAKRWKDIH